jgi:hypothetical protein
MRAHVYIPYTHMPIHTFPHSLSHTHTHTHTTLDMEKRPLESESQDSPTTTSTSPSSSRLRGEKLYCDRSVLLTTAAFSTGKALAIDSQKSET